MKQENGITMISLVIIIMIMAVLIGIVVYTTSPLLQKSNIEDLTTELMLIQAKWKIEREKVNFDGKSIFNENLINTDGDNKGKLKEDYEYSIQGDEAWVESGITYFELPEEALEIMGLRLQENFGYLVNYENDEIIYLPGIEDKIGNIYYKLSEIKEL